MSRSRYSTSRLDSAAALPIPAPTLRREVIPLLFAHHSFLH
jgi:hypothetical protein